MVIDLFTLESETSDFIQDVLSSVNYEVNVFESPHLNENSFAPIVLWNLDSFVSCNRTALANIRKKSPDSMIFAFANNLEPYSGFIQNYADAYMDNLSLRLHLMTQLSSFKKIIHAKKIFQERMSHLVGNSPSMEQLRKNILQAMIHTSPVLIQGETGAGKELIARAVACMYDKFITVNCSAIPDNLFESELFGHKRGAFTGAQTDRIGLFEEAHGGAIFLDEIGDMPLHSQVKLLRVLQNNEIRPVGSNITKHINVRIIAATNRNLKQAVEEKSFREDLYYRLNVISLKVAPLRDRIEDIEPLANYFIKQYQPPGENRKLTPEALQILQQHNWPGNIRELENLIQRTLCFSNNYNIGPEDLCFDPEEDSVNLPKVSSMPTIPTDLNTLTYEEFRLAQLEQEGLFLKKRIEQNGGSVNKTAKQLGLIRTALYNRLRRLNINIKNL